MRKAPVVRRSSVRPVARRRPGSRQHLHVEQLERRELLDTGLGSTVGLTASTSSQLVGALYKDLLHRAAQPSEIAGWQSALDTGLSPTDLARAFLASPEYLADRITDTYATLLHRAAQPQEVAGWLQPMEAGLSEERLTTLFLASDEYYGQHGGTVDRWLTGLYGDLFQRAPDAAGFLQWSEELQTGTPRETVAYGFVTSPETSSRVVTAAYQQFLGRAPDPAGASGWVAALTAGMPRTELFAGIIGSPEYVSLHTGSGPLTLPPGSPDGPVVPQVPLTVTITGAPASSPVGIPVSLTSTVTASSAATAADFTYRWTVTQDGAAFASAATPDFSFTPTKPATYEVTLVATASDNSTGTASQIVTVTDVSPLVKINEAAATGTVGSTIALTSTVSSPSPAEMAAGFVYAWSVTKNNAAFAWASAPNFSFTPDSSGTYVVTLTVKDSDGAAATDSKTITVPATPSQPATGAFITTPYDRIPNFGAHPNRVSATSGPWSSPSTWSTGSVPGAGDVVSINANTTVTYDLVSDAAVNTVIVQAGGRLVFRTDVSTRLTVVNLIVLEGGELQIGTAGNPVDATVKAEVVFANQALDTAFDPAQYGNGLIGLGKLTMYGAAKSDTFVKLAAEPKAGDTTLTLSQPVTGWQAGDKLILPDTRQLIAGVETDKNYVDQMERPAIASVSSDGRTVTLSSPLQYDHLGARDGNGALTFLPYVGNLSRNVLVRSQSATGTRGHATFTYHADVDIRYAGFYGLGRTQEAALDDTSFDASGNATHIGSNQSGRYPVYFNHLVGPSSVPSDGYQYTFTGNAIFCPLDPMPFRWGLALNDSHYGLIQDNVLDNWAGAGIVTESGNESYNVIAHNFVVDITNQNGSIGLTWERADSRGLKDLASEGVGFWFRGFNNYVRDNVAADCGSYGYTYFAQYVDSVKVPLAPGNDTITAGQYQTVDMNGTPILEFSGNEALGATPSGMTIWWLATMFHTPRDQTPISIVKDFHVWHVHQQGFFGYEMNRVTFDGLVVRGDFGLLAQNKAFNQGFGANDYYVKDLLIENSDIQGMRIGFEPSTGSGGGIQTIQQTYLRNYFNVYLEHLWTSAYRSDTIPPRVTVVRDCIFAAPNVPDFSGPDGPKQNIVMNDSIKTGAVNLIQTDQLFVYDYNGVAGDNFQVYYLGQSPTAVVPQSILNSDGTPMLDTSPLAGLTNQLNWAIYNLAIAGAVSPTSTTRAGITGFVRAF